jgi:invasion protein IalB
MADGADSNDRGPAGDKLDADVEVRSQPAGRRLSVVQLVLLALIVIVLLACGAGIGYFWLNARDVGAIDASAAVALPIPVAPPAAATPAPAIQQAAVATQQAAATPSPAPTPANAPKITTFADWVLACPPEVPDSQKCVVEQQVRSRDGKSLFMVWSFRKDAQGAVHGSWQTPPNAVQAQGIAIDIGDGQPKLLKFSSCTAKACTALAAPTPDYLQKLEASTSLAATFSTTDSATPLRLGLSSRGLVEALSHIPPA